MPSDLPYAIALSLAVTIPAVIGVSGLCIAESLPRRLWRSFRRLTGDHSIHPGVFVSLLSVGLALFFIFEGVWFIAVVPAFFAIFSAIIVVQERRERRSPNTNGND